MTPLPSTISYATPAASGPICCRAPLGHSISTPSAPDRVPIPNAYELRQGLEDRGVPVEMIVYKGFGHGITKPKSMRAVMQHNLGWFNHYIFGDAKPDLTGR